jgi:hypothetical protein
LTLTKRLTKGSRLTHAEMDANLTHFESLFARLVFSGDYASSALYDSARALLTNRLGAAGIDVDRTAGTVDTGAVFLNHFQNTFSGHAGGGSQVDGLRVLQTSNGGSAVDQSIAGRFTSIVSGSGAVTTLRGALGEVRLTGSGNVGGALGVSSGFQLTSTGSVTVSVQMFRAESPTITGAGTVQEINGLRLTNLGHANITELFGIRIDDQTSATGNIYGFYSNITSGSTKWALYMAGNSKSHFGGRLLLNQTTDDGSSQVQLTGTGTVLKINATNNTYVDVTDGTRDVGMGIISSLGFFGTLSNHGVIISTNNSQRVAISNAGVVTINNLAGTGTRNVVVDANGVLSAP